ncbi:MAG: hypothetical protein NVS9B10_26340 [Nevskia sp.]
MKLEVDIADEDVHLIQALIASVGEREGGNTHGRLNLPKLTRMLLEDVALAWRRPGSWEGANMTQVLESHGYSRFTDRVRRRADEEADDD